MATHDHGLARAVIAAALLTTPRFQNVTAGFQPETVNVDAWRDTEHLRALNAEVNLIYAAATQPAE